jgi:hypothetical protein
MPKISDLSAVTDTEATGDDYVPVVSGGTTKRMLLSELTEEVVALGTLATTADLEDVAASGLASDIAADSDGFTNSDSTTVQDVLADLDAAIDSEIGITADLVNVAGDLIKADGPDSVDRFPIGAANEVLSVNAAGADLDYRDAYALPQTVATPEVESFTVALDQVGQWVPCEADDADARVITLPQDSDVAVPVGSTIVFEFLDPVAEWTFSAGVGATILDEEGRTGDPVAAGQGAVVFVFKQAADTWRVSGALAIETGTWVEDGSQTGELSGGKLTISQVISDQTYTQTEDPLPYLSGGRLGSAFLSQGTVELDNAGEALIGPVASVGMFGPPGIFQSEMTQIVHQTQHQYAHGPVGFQEQMMIKNVPGETRQIAGPSYSFVASRMVAADGGTVTLKKNDAEDGFPAFHDVSTLCTAGSGTLNANEDSDYAQIGFKTQPLLIGNVELSRRVGFWVADPLMISGGVEALFDGTVGHRLSNDLDGDAPVLTSQTGVQIDRLTEATTNVGIRCDSQVDLWSDTVTFTANPPDAILSNGTRTWSTGSDIPGQFCDITGTEVIDVALNALFGGFQTFFHRRTFKSATNATARTVPYFRGYEDAPTFTADTSADTFTTIDSFMTTPTTSIANAGTLAITTFNQFHAAVLAVGTGVTITTSRGLYVESPTGAGTVTNCYGIDIAAITEGSTKKRAIRIGAASGGLELAQDTANSTTTTLPASSSAWYVKSNNLCFAYNDAGTMRFLFIPLTGTGTTWTHDTTGP